MATGTTAAKLLAKTKKAPEVPQEETVTETPVEVAQTEEEVVGTAVETKVEEPKAAAKKTKKAPIEDLIVKTSHEMENITKEQAIALAKELSDSIEFNYFRLGGALYSIQSKDYWKGVTNPEGVPYDTFRSMMGGEYGLNYRKGMYLVGIYTALVESGIAWDSVKDVGWTKLKEICAVITKENVKEWVDRAKVMTTLQLIDYIKNLGTPGTEPGTPGTPKEDDSAKVTTITFKVHPDQAETINQAIEKAMKANNTDVRTVALDFICMSYLEGKTGKAKVAKAKPFAEVVAEKVAAGEEAFWEEFGNLFPQYDIQIAEAGDSPEADGDKEEM